MASLNQNLPSNPAGGGTWVLRLSMSRGLVPEASTDHPSRGWGLLVGACRLLTACFSLMRGWISHSWCGFSSPPAVRCLQESHWSDSSGFLVFCYLVLCKSLVPCIVPLVPCLVSLVPCVAPLVPCGVSLVPSVVPLVHGVVPLVAFGVPLVPCVLPLVLVLVEV